MAADHFYLVFAFAHLPGIPVYLYRLAEVSDGARDATPVVKPVFDDDIKFSQVWINAEFAIQARDHWRAKGYSVVLKDNEGNGPLFERETTEEPRYDASRSPRFVLFSNGLGLIATPGNGPSGSTWFVRASDIPAFAAEGRHTSIESVSGETPASAAERAVALWGHHILFRDPAQDEREAKEREEKLKNAKALPSGVVLRPGDRH